MAAKILKMNVSKIDAAKRQLEMAITLYFSKADSVSVHTLAAAAHEILRALGKSRGVKSLLKDIKDLGAQKEKEKEWSEILNEAQNFFKHGDRDSDASFEFRPTMTEFLIYDACLMYIQVTTGTPKLLHIFNHWFTINHPYLLAETVRNQWLGQVGQVFSTHDRSTFYKEASDAYDVGTSEKQRNPEA